MLLKVQGLVQLERTLHATINEHGRLLQQPAQKFGVGALTFQDRIDVLVRPGLDSREELPSPLLRAKALSRKDLEIGMISQGSVR